MKAVEFAEIINPCPEWNGRIWYAGHFYSGREPSTARFDPEINGRAHAALDLGAPMLSDMISPYPGAISTVGYNSGAGNWLGIRHLHKSGSWFFSRHLHIARDGILVKRGQEVEAGQHIARVGSTGASAGPHDDFQLIWGKDRAHWTEDRHIDVEWVLLGVPGRKEPTKKMITDIQQMLTDLGYSPGPVDGIWGKKTRAAEMKYRQDSLEAPSMILPTGYEANMSVKNVEWVKGAPV